MQTKPYSPRADRLAQAIRYALAVARHKEAKPAHGLPMPPPLERIVDAPSGVA